MLRPDYELLGRLSAPARPAKPVPTPRAVELCHDRFWRIVNNGFDEILGYRVSQDACRVADVDGARDMAALVGRSIAHVPHDGIAKMLRMQRRFIVFLPGFADSSCKRPCGRVQ